jgi:hypothetical protein
MADSNRLSPLFEIIAIDGAYMLCDAYLKIQDLV